MNKVVFTCQHHTDVVIRDKFSTCPRCVYEFFKKHNLYTEESPTEIRIEDIIVEMDDILLKEELCLSSSVSAPWR